jgi:DNA-binding response OmpR family regulator
MPVLTGLQLVRKLRAGKFAGKILVLSACLSPAIEQAYRELGVNDIHHKPFDIGPLRLAIGQFVATLDAGSDH